LKLDYQEILHNYLTRLVIFSVFLFKDQRRQENVYQESVRGFIKRRFRTDIELILEVGPKISIDEQRDIQIESILNNDESKFLNLVVVQFKTGFKEVTIQINLNDEYRYESYLYS
jgi:hypothetical protein